MKITSYSVYAVRENGVVKIKNWYDMKWESRQIFGKVVYNWINKYYIGKLVSNQNKYYVNDSNQVCRWLYNKEKCIYSENDIKEIV